jgi:hypothetical protein
MRTYQISSWIEWSDLFKLPNLGRLSHYYLWHLSRGYYIKIVNPDNPKKRSISILYISSPFLSIKIRGRNFKVDHSCHHDFRSVKTEIADDGRLVYQFHSHFYQDKTQQKSGRGEFYLSTSGKSVSRGTFTYDCGNVRNHVALIPISEIERTIGIGYLGKFGGDDKKFIEHCIRNFDLLVKLFV